MPELPEVETIVRGLSEKLIGLEISSVEVLSPSALRREDVIPLNRWKGCRIIGVRRRGKMILIDCTRNRSLIIHLKMTGQLFFSLPSEPLDKHTHVVFHFKKNPWQLRFRDTRKFGFLSPMKTSDLPLSKELGGLGPEPLEIDFTRFARRLRGRKARLKSLLLDQSVLAGIGNIYADEILFSARLHPFIPASSLGELELRCLWKAMRRVLRKAVAHRGSSIRSYRDACGRSGSFQLHHRVYGRESMPCPVCGQRIERLRLSQRSCFFCPSCQPSVMLHAG